MDNCACKPVQGYISGKRVLNKMEGIDENLGHLFKKIHNAFEVNFNREIREMGMTAAQFDVLVYLVKVGCPATQKDIETFLMLSNPTVTGILNRMEGKRLICRNRMERDKRCHLITMTERSRELLGNMCRKREENERRLVSNMTEAEVAELISLLKIVLANLTTE